MLLFPVRLHEAFSGLQPELLDKPDLQPPSWNIRSGQDLLPFANPTSSGSHNTAAPRDPVQTGSVTMHQWDHSLILQQLRWKWEFRGACPQQHGDAEELTC